jgi:hypothetical protein
MISPVRNQCGAAFVEVALFRERRMSKSSSVIVLAVAVSLIGSTLSFAQSSGGGSSGGGSSSAGGGAASSGSAVSSPAAG